MVCSYSRATRVSAKASISFRFTSASNGRSAAQRKAIAWPNSQRHNWQIRPYILPLWTLFTTARLTGRRFNVPRCSAALAAVTEQLSPLEVYGGGRGAAERERKLAALTKYGSFVFACDERPRVCPARPAAGLFLGQNSKSPLIFGACLLHKRSSTHRMTGQSAMCRLTLDEKFAICRSVGEECIQEDELRNLLAKKPNIVAYDGFEPSGRMHIAQVGTCSLDQRLLFPRAVDLGKSLLCNRASSKRSTSTSSHDVESPSSSGAHSRCLFCR